MKEIKVSVLVPVYNVAFFIRETIDSVLVQTFKDFELLLMDDGSTDSTIEIIKSYNDSRIKYKLCMHNFVDTLNHGLEKNSFGMRATYYYHGVELLNRDEMFFVPMTISHT